MLQLFFALLIAGTSCASEIEKISLDAAIDRALTNNYEIKILKNDYTIAEQFYPAAKGIWDTYFAGESAYLDSQKPKAFVFFGGSEVTYDWDLHLTKKLPTGTEFTLEMLNNRFQTSSASFVVNPSFNTQFGLIVTQPFLLNGFGIVDRSEVEQASIDGKDLTLQTANNIEQVIVRVSHAYWNLVLGEEKVRIRDDALKQAKRLGSSNERKYKDGLIEEPELYASRANLTLREHDLYLVQEELQHFSNELALILGDANANYRSGQNLDFKMVKISFEDGLAYAQEHRRDLHQSKMRKHRAELGALIASNRKLPKADFKGSLHYAGLDSTFAIAIKETSRLTFPIWFAGLEVSYPLENNTARADYHVARAEELKTDLQLLLTEQTVIKEIRDTYLVVTTLEQLVIRRKKIEDLERKKLAEETKKFKRGRSGINVVIDYQEDLLDAELEAANSKASYLKSLIDWENVQDSLLIGKRFSSVRP